MNKIRMDYLCGCGYLTVKSFNIEEWFPTYVQCEFCSKDSEVIREHKIKVQQNDAHYLQRISRPH